MQDQFFLNYCCVPLYITLTFGKILVQVHSWLKQTQNKQWTKQIIGVLLKGNGLLKFYFIGVSWLATALQSYCGNAGRNRKVPEYWELCAGCNGWGKSCLAPVLHEITFQLNLYRQVHDFRVGEDGWRENICKLWFVTVHPLQLGSIPSTTSPFCHYCSLQSTESMFYSPTLWKS